MTKKETTEVATTTGNNMTIFGDDYKKDLAKNLEGMDNIQLPKIKIMKESASFDMGDEIPIKEVTGYIIGHTVSRAHWSKPMDQWVTEDDKRPDCVSHDGKAGTFHARACGDCHKNRFNSKNIAPDKFDECKTSLNLFIAVDGQGELPFHLRAAATSLKYWQPFAIKVTGKGWPIIGTHVKFTLKKEERNNMKYSTLQYEILGSAPDRETYNKLKTLSEQFQSAMFKGIENTNVEAPITNDNPY